MHTIIGEFGKELRQIAEMDEIDSILTGTISPSKSYRETLTFQYFTENGVKLLAKTTTAVQEIFLVTAAPELVLDQLVKSGHVLLQREDVRHGDPRGKRNKKARRRGPSAAPADLPASVAVSGSASDSRTRAAASRNNDRRATPASPVGEADPLTLGQHLGTDTLSALQRLKEEVTPKQRTTADSPANGAGRERGKAGPAATARRPLSQRDLRRQQEDDEESFAKLFAPAEDEESFEDLLNKSKLDPKFFK